MTINDIKRAFSKYGVKLKKNVPFDTEITIDDIARGTYFTSFKDSHSLGLIISGLFLVNGEVAYVCPLVKEIDIDCDKNFPPCGGEEEVIVNAIFDLQCVFLDGTTSILSENRISRVVALISVSGDESFVYEKPFLKNYEPNNTDSEKKATITAKYYHNGKQFVAYREITQTLNSYSSWLTTAETTTAINVICEGNTIPNNGGRSKISVERVFSRIEVKRDSCGNISGEKNTPNLTEDITSKALITISNKRDFRLVDGYVIAEAQKAEAPEREVTVTARYGDSVGKATIVQSKGGDVTYLYDLSFADGSKIMYHDLDTSLETKQTLPIVCEKHKYVGDKFIEKRPSAYLNVMSDSSWISGVPYMNGDSVELRLTVSEPNQNKEGGREAEITISCINDPTTSIRLIVYQDALSIVEQKYNIFANGGGTYTTEELNSADIYFQPVFQDVYENGFIENNPISSDLKMDIKYKCSDSSRLYPSSLTEVNGKWYVNFINNTKSSMKDIALIIIGAIKDSNNKVICESDPIPITVKGNDIIDYNYELCFDGHNKYIKKSWSNNTDSVDINITSVRHKLVNGKEVSVEPVKFKVTHVKDNSEQFDNVFSKKVNESSITVFPYKVNENVSFDYIITQDGSDLSLKMTLEYSKEEYKKLVRVTVDAVSENITNDVWTGDGGYLSIDNNINIPLNPCWLFPNMKDKRDTAFSGMVELTNGEHLFETHNVISLDAVTKTHKPCNVSKVVDIKETTQEVILELKLN